MTERSKGSRLGEIETLVGSLCDAGAQRSSCRENLFKHCDTSQFFALSVFFTLVCD